MSIELHAFLRSNRVPLRDEWQRAIDESGLGLTISSDLTPREDSGFLPCRLDGLAELTGFEIYYESTTELQEDYPSILEAVGDRDSCISFRITSRMAECASMLIAAAALARSSDAVVYDPTDDTFHTADDLEVEARKCLEIVESEAQGSSP